MIKKSLIALSGMFIVSFLNYLFHLIISRTLSVADYGDVAILISFIAIIYMPFGGILTTLSRRIAKLNHQNKTGEIYGLVKHYFKKLSKWTLLFSAAVFIFFTIAHFITPYSKLFIGLQIVSIAMPIGILLSMTKGYLQGREEITKLMLINIAEPVIKIAFTLLLALQFNLGFFGVTIALISSGVILSVSIAPIFFKKTKEAAGEHVIDFGAIPIIITHSIIVLMLYMDILFVKLFVGAEGAGYYNIAGITAKLLYFAAGAITLVLLPMSSKLNSDSDKKEILVLLLKGAGLLTMGLIAGLVVSGWFIPLFFSAKYLVSVQPFMFLIFGMYFLGISTLIFNILWSQHMEKKVLMIVAIVLPVQILLLSYFVPAHNIVGAAIATMITCAILLAISLFYFARMLKTTKNIQKPVIIPPAQVS